MQPSVISAAAWRLGVTLGSGVTGTVSVGCSPLGLPVAIKVPSREGRHKQGREAQVHQLQNEVDALQALSPLQGVAVPRLVAYGTLVSRANDHFPCVVTELLQGAVPLSEVGAQQLPVTLKEDAMALMDAVHARGVAHCDINADHVLLMPDGTLRLIDFGHASLKASPGAMARDVEALRCVLAGLPEPPADVSPHAITSSPPGILPEPPAGTTPHGAPSPTSPPATPAVAIQEADVDVDDDVDGVAGGLQGGTRGH